MQNDTLAPPRDAVFDRTAERANVDQVALRPTLQAVDSPAPLARDHALIATNAIEPERYTSDRESLIAFMSKPSQRVLISENPTDNAHAFADISNLDIAAAVIASLILIGPLAAATIGALFKS